MPDGLRKSVQGICSRGIDMWPSKALCGVDISIHERWERMLMIAVKVVGGFPPSFRLVDHELCGTCRRFGATSIPIRTLLDHDDKGKEDDKSE